MLFNPNTNQRITKSAFLTKSLKTKQFSQCKKLKNIEFHLSNES